MALYLIKDQMGIDEVVDSLGELPGEGRKARRALVDYALMRNRSLVKLVRRYRDEEHPPTRSIKTLERWSSKFNWQHRVSRLDRVKETERLEDWVRRREELDESDWSDGNELRKQALQALSNLDDSPSLLAIANVLQLASKLQRLAAGSSTENVNLVGQSLIAAIEHELARLGYDQATGGLQLPVSTADPDDDPVS